MSRCWLMKSEPNTYSIDDLARDGSTHWDGVRNYQARNMMRDDMKKGDLVFFYHSNCPEPGIAGIMKIVREGYPDHTAFDRRSKYYDPKSDPENPHWFMVDVQFVRKLSRVIPLSELKENPKLDDMQLVKRGNRLSIMPVNKKQWDTILGLE
jgi:predicted RNA-binding protein with PUA-like domain